MHIKYTWDAEKRQNTLTARGIDFAIMLDFDWDSALVIADDRMDYGETRLRALGMIDERLYAVVVTPREEGLRIISLRKANTREQKQWQNR